MILIEDVIVGMVYIILFSERSELNRCGDQNQHSGDNHATWSFY